MKNLKKLFTRFFCLHFNLIDLYAPCNDYSLVVKQLKYSKENTCLYKCYILNEDDVAVGKYFKFYDELGKFNVGDTLKIVKNETK